MYQVFPRLVQVGNYYLSYVITRWIENVKVKAQVLYCS
jgi:hypothetical protein